MGFALDFINQYPVPSSRIKLTTISKADAPISTIPISLLASTPFSNTGACFCNIQYSETSEKQLFPPISNNQNECKKTVVFSEAGTFLNNCQSAGSKGCACNTSLNITATAKYSGSGESTYCADNYNENYLQNCGLDSTGWCICKNSAGTDIRLADYDREPNKCSEANINSVVRKNAASNCEWVGLDITKITPTQTFMENITEGSFNEIQAILNKPQLQIKIPGLSFSGEGIKAVEDEFGSKYFIVPFLGEYISAVYKFAVAAGSVVAVVMIIIAGFQWTASGGGQEGIASAKKRIVASVIGLILLVGSYTLLYTINPNLVEFNGLKVRYIEGRTFEDATDGAEILGAIGLLPEVVPTGPIPNVTINKQLVEEVIRSVGWNEQSTENSVTKERIPFYLVVRLANENVGLLGLFLSVGRWGIKNPPADLIDPAGKNWNGVGKGMGKHLMDIDSGGLGIAHFCNVKDLTNLYKIYGKPVIPESWISKDYHWMQCRGGKKYSNWAGNSYCTKYAGNSKEETDEQAWLNWEAWATSVLQKPSAHIFLIDGWYKNYWAKSLSYTNNDIEKALINVRINNSRPTFAENVGNQDPETQMDLYAKEFNEEDRKGVMRRPYAVYIYLKSKGMIE